MPKNLHVAVYALLETTDLKHGVSAWVCAFMYGLHRHGIKNTQFIGLRGLKEPVKCDLGVLWGVRHTQIVDYHRENGIPLICIERGFIPNRSQWSMAGYNGLNGLANFCNENSPMDRWEKHYIGKMKPWNTSGKYVLLLGQTQGDSAIYGLDMDKWVMDCTLFFKKNNIPFVYRPHPGEVLVPLDVVPELDAAIKDSFCVVTYNSSAGVQSILAGKPTISLHRGSMAWDVTRHSLEACLEKYTPDRGQWAANLTYTQWRRDEMTNGDTWEHLKKGFEYVNKLRKVSK